MTEQQKYWKSILEHAEFRCIYSNKPVNNVTGFALDHYVPWSFVAHNQLWNLIPTLSRINSQKSNYLPPNESLNKFVLAQHQGLTIAKEILPSSQWNKATEPYLLDLKLSADDLLSVEKLSKAYEHNLKPLIELAKQQGFEFWHSTLLAKSL